MEYFSCKTKIVSGEGAVAALGELGIRRLLLVTEPVLEKNGTASRIISAARAEAARVFCGSAPSVETAAAGTAAARQFGPDTIVALGNDCVIDCAKVLAYFAGDPVRLVAIPTAFGASAEVTDAAVLTRGQERRSIADVRLRPDVAILDSALLPELPPPLVADAGFDVLCHGLEAYVATGAGAITDALARDAFTTVFSALPAAYAGKSDARQRIHTAAAMAGMAFAQAGLGFCCAMADTLGGAFSIPRGRLGAMLLPAVIDCNAYAAAWKYAGLARGAGLGGSSDAAAVLHLKNALIRLRRELRMPDSLAQAGVDPGRVRRRAGELVRAVLEAPGCRTNPIPVEDFMVRRLLEEVTGRVYASGDWKTKEMKILEGTV